MKKAIEEARVNTETLQTYVHKINEGEYMKRLMKRLNSELSPLRDESTRDPFFIRNMWEHYQRNKVFEQSASSDEIRRNPEQVYAFLKRMESG